MKMTEEIEYKRNNLMHEETSQWALAGTTSELSLSDLSRTSEYHTHPFSLQILAKKKEESHRPLIKATTEELLCFFRLYVTTIAKTHIISMFEGGINWFFWYHVQNLIFNSLPHVFVQVFLAVYVPEEHFYLDKMNPLLFGYNFLVIFAAFFELMLFVSSNMYLLDYLWLGLTMRNPWNRCSYSYIRNMMNTSYTVNCLTLEEFSEKVKTALSKNQTLYFYTTEYYLKGDNGTELFQIPQIMHFRDRYIKRHLPFQETVFGIYFIILWCLAAIHYNEFFKKTIWKIFRIASYAEILINLAVTAYIFLRFTVLDPSLKNAKVTRADEYYPDFTEDLDIDTISLALNAPPVIHVLISRSTSDHSRVQYRSLSALIVASSWIYSFWNGFIFKYLKDYCEKVLGVGIIFSSTNSYGFFYIYSIYFSYFLMGNIFFSVFLLFKSVTDFYLFVITYQCLMETIICEWKFVTKIMISSFVALMALLTFLLLNDELIITAFLYTKSIALATEVYGIYLLYPLGRLIEDIVFQSGIEPHMLQIWSLRLVPIFISIKLYYLLEIIITNFQLIAWFWFMPILVLIMGAIYNIYNYMWVEKRGFLRLFCPDSEWGPADYLTRHCRKMYKKHEYIGSQADRALSRYMINKREAEVYHLDVRYDPNRRSTDVSHMQYEYEKKFM